MIQQRSLSLLSSAERHLLRQNRAYAGQCIRCIHTSKPVKAEESKSNGNDNGTPYNAPKRRSNRQERAAKVSSEVSALAADLPKANLSGRNAEVDGAQPKSSGVSPQAQGKDVAPGRMGDNDSPRREGPFVQGVGRVVRSSDEDPTYSKEARGIRTPDSKIETPSEGGASVMEPMGTAPEAPVAKQPNAGTAEAPAATTTPTTKSPSVAPAKEVVPSKSEQTIAQYLHSANGTSTLLNSNFLGMIADRAAVLSPRASPSTPTKAEFAFRLRRNKKQLTAFDTQADKDAFTKAESKLPKFRPLPKSAQQVIINRMVLGKYDKHRLLRGYDLHKQQPLLNPVHRELLKNPTYLAKDAKQFMGKLKGLLPTTGAEAVVSRKEPELKQAKA
ncbi:hypothetical protein MBLNU13_g00729t1 [Cladosporium sp. NU13]